MSGLVRSCGVIESTMASMRRSCLSSTEGRARYSFRVTCQEYSRAAELAHHFELREEIVEIEFRAAQLSLQPLRFFFVYRSAAFSTNHDVAHSENATRQPIGDEGFELIELFANSGEFDWALRHFAHGESCTARASPSEFGQTIPVI